MILKILRLTIVFLVELVFAKSLKADTQVVIALLLVHDRLLTAQVTIHGAWIVLVSIGWHRIRTPVKIDTKFGILEPLR